MVGGALQKLFAVAHLLLRQEKDNKLSFYLLLIAKVLLRSKSGFWFRLLVGGGLVLCWLLQKWTEISEALQKFSFYWRFACWESWRVLVWVGGALQKHFLLRSKLWVLYGSLVCLAERTENAESFLASLEI